MQCSTVVERGAFTHAQIKEQTKFLNELENGVADVFFEGSAIEAKALLGGLNSIVERRPH